MAERLHVFIARAGIASRRAAERLILGGHVTVNGKSITVPGTTVESGTDIVCVDNKPVPKAAGTVTVVLNKPKGVVTTCQDPQGRVTTASLVRHIKCRLFPVGRLDYNTEGLLLLTNDGELSNRLQHPRYGIPKTYETKVQGKPTPQAIDRLRKGIVLDGRPTAPADVRIVDSTGNNAWLRITISEGRNRQVRRMCEAVGHPVVKLRRVRYGPIHLGDLQPGKYRHMTPAEIEGLNKYIDAEAPAENSLAKNSDNQKIS